ncbi:T9SS type A sorting domain-containing protein [Namhaeicola litoreus]|uniref:T9SS type A sorting domain-containing protein n=1 Tax=Namhaeicola litoreus TaxID=1052145 RepID=A0ABW3XZF6_9FLAO
MKKNRLLLIFFFIITWISFAQRENMTMTDVITLNATNYNSESQTLTVPNGKTWVINGSGKWYIAVKVKGGNTFEGAGATSRIGNDDPFFFTEGMELYFGEGGDTNAGFTLIQILVYDIAFDGTLAIEESTMPKENLMVYPNPTDSRLTINSDKIFKVEVYDLYGRKMFETDRSSIDFSQLKMGIYLVNLYDNNDRIVSTYKVIKN